MKQLAFLIVFILVASACKEVFDIPPQSRVKATLVDSVTKENTTSVMTIVPVEHDSVFYDEESAGSFILPLSPDDATSFRVTFDSVTDTITFRHKTSIQYESMESGFYYEYKLKQVESTRHRIASIQITDSLVTSTLHENIKIYIRPLSSGSN